MINKMRMVLAQTLAAVLVFVAYTGIGPCCWFITYEPEIPESLKH